VIRQVMEFIYRTDCKPIRVNHEGVYSAISARGKTTNILPAESGMETEIPGAETPGISEMYT
jgi:hypothetical protein